MENFKSDSIKSLVEAVVKTISEIPNIDKNMQVGEGKYSYNGVSDKDVKDVVGKKMAENGLCILPIEINATENVERYKECDKQKQTTMCIANTKYLLSHTSGEWIILAGYGHGVDSQDKAAGKATTYAMKYMMLYTFAVATGSIDDADTTHSNDLPVVQEKKSEPKQKKPETKRECMTPNHVRFAEFCQKIETGAVDKLGNRITSAAMQEFFACSPEAIKQFDAAEKEFLTNQNK